MTEQELVERLRAGIRYLPKLATADSEEYQQFRAAGDAIAVNEGDLWNAVVLAMPQAADAIERLVRERAASQAVIEVQRQQLTTGGWWKRIEAAEARASSAEAQLAEMREALRKIVSCYDRNWQHQREKLDDIVPMARAALEQSQ